MEIQLQNKFFTAYKLFENVTCIAGMGGELCYLVQGSERALLIDGLAGVGSLQAFVRQLTDLPVMLALTHGHIDHAGAAYEYGECYMSPDDIALMYTPHHSGSEGRLKFVTGPLRPGIERRCTPVLSDVVPAKAVKTYPLYEGDLFDLGGVQIQALAVPGHTYGTLVFLYRERRIVFSGDACNLNTLVGLPGSTTIEEYRESLVHFKDFVPAFDALYGGHGMNAVPVRIVDDGIALCDAILARTDDAVPADHRGSPALLGKKRGANFMPLDGSWCNIMYRPDMLRKRPHPVIAGEPNLYR